jgi:Leucine-rich repeat (LRR) protein
MAQHRRDVIDGSTHRRDVITFAMAWCTRQAHLLFNQWAHEYTQLVRLELNVEGLTVIPTLKGCTNLRSLSLNSNQLTSLEGLQAVSVSSGESKTRALAPKQTQKAS